MNEERVATLYRFRKRIIQEAIDDLPGECKRMIADNGGVVIGQYGGEANHSRLDVVCGESSVWLSESFCLWIGFNGRVRDYALKEILQHELAHIIFYTEMMLDLDLDRPSYSVYLAAMERVGRKFNPAYSSHGSVWRKIYARLTGKPASAARSYAMPYDCVGAARWEALMPKADAVGIEPFVYGLYLDTPHEFMPTLSLCGGVLADMEREAANVKA